MPSTATEEILQTKEGSRRPAAGRRRAEALSRLASAAGISMLSPGINAIREMRGQSFVVSDRGPQNSKIPSTFSRSLFEGTFHDPAGNHYRCTKALARRWMRTVGRHREAVMSMKTILVPTESH